MIDVASTQLDHGPAATPTDTPAPVQPDASLVRRLLGGLPTLLVLAVLAGLAYLGHHTGWAIPKLSALTGDNGNAKDDWCTPHTVPESLCVECQPGLLPKRKEHGFCKKHGVAECALCYPDVAQLPSPPNITPEDHERAKRALKLVNHPDNDPKCKKHLRRLQLASQAAADKAGIQAEPAWKGPVVEAIASNGEVTYDQTRVARLSSRLPGTVWWVARQVGDPVRPGDVLALVDAAEVGKAKAEFLQAFALVDLKSRTLEGMRVAGAALPVRTLQEAESALREARIRMLSAQQALVNLGLPVPAEELKNLSEDQLAQRIQFLGLPESLTHDLDPRTTSGNLLPVRSPIEGLIVNREVVAGEVVDAAKVLFVVADPSKMWLTLNIRLEDARRVQLEQPVHFRPDGQAPAGLPWYTAISDRLTWNQTVDGTVSWISTAVDEKTRTVKVRVDLANPDGRFRAGTFGSGRIVLREDLAVVVPKDAVQWEGCCHIVFVQDKNYHAPGAPKVFHVRKVVPGATDDKTTEIITGLLPGEVVAIKGAGVLRSELLKNDLGDG